MIELLRTWILGLSAAALCISLLWQLLPRGTARAAAQLTGGLVLLLVVLRPLTQLGIDLPENDYSRCRQQMDRQIEEYRAGYERELTDIIERETAAYISKKAGDMGIACQVRVTARLTDGVPVPAEVYLDVPFRPELSAWISEEAGIAEAQQTWEAGE